MTNLHSRHLLHTRFRFSRSQRFALISRLLTLPPLTHLHAAERGFAVCRLVADDAIFLIDIACQRLGGVYAGRRDEFIAAGQGQNGHQQD